MELPEMIELRRTDFITIDTIGPPGERTFYLQAAQDDMLVTLIIEKEQAAALSIAISGILEKLGGPQHEIGPGQLDLVQPVVPLFRVGRLGLGYDEEQDKLVVMAEELVGEDRPHRTKVHIWISHTQMAALAHQAATAVRAGRPICPLCGETIELGEKHVCVRGNGRKHLDEIE